MRRNAALKVLTGGAKSDRPSVGGLKGDDLLWSERLPSKALRRAMIDLVRAAVPELGDPVQLSARLPS